MLPASAQGSKPSQPRGPIPVPWTRGLRRPHSEWYILHVYLQYVSSSTHRKEARQGFRAPLWLQAGIPRCSSLDATAVQFTCPLPRDK